MSTRIEKRASTITSAKDIARRVKTIEWKRVSQDLDAEGKNISVIGFALHLLL
jgi:hypothetical protein